MPLHKRKQIEERLGRSLQAYLRARFLRNATQVEVASELGLDRSTIRYYRKKWDLPYNPELAREKKREKAKAKWNHVEICICPYCRHGICQEEREAHYSGRCVVWCRSFEGRATGLNLLRARR